MPIISNVKILVVEPDPLLRAFLADVLEFSVNRKVIVFENGLEALNYLTEHGPADIIISEADLPGISGLNFLNTVKEKWPERICILASDDPAVFESAQNAGLEAYLNKPFGTKDVFSIVQRFVVDGQRRA